jgi:hypothetical protein
MKFYVDENISPNIAKALAILQNSRLDEHIEVLLIKEEFGRGKADEEWIPIVANEDAIAITQDINIQRVKHQRELCKHYGLSIVFFKPPKKGYQYWDLVEFYIRKWNTVKKEASKLNKPFSLLVTPRKTRPERL